MAWLSEQLSKRFQEWERRGRGWQVWPVPVSPEPAFEPFTGQIIPDASVTDDGRRPTVLSSFLPRLSQKLSPKPPIIPSREEEEEEALPELLEREELVELQVSLPADYESSPKVFGQLLGALAYCREPIGFELIGLPEFILNQFVAHPADIPTLQRQLQAHFPEAVCVRQTDVLTKSWGELAEAYPAVVEFGLAREFMLPLATNSEDVLIGLTAALAELQPDELGLYQVLFQPVRQAWADSLVRAVSDGQGGPAFVNAPELLTQGKWKVSQPLFAAVVRIATRSENFDRAWEIARDMAGALGGFADLLGNELIPLHNDEYPIEDHAEDVWRRQSRRSGVILDQDELVGFVHLPSAAVRTPKLRRALRKTKRAPKVADHQQGLLLGHNEHAGETVPVSLIAEQRVRHLHAIGASGTGKSTFLFNLIRQDIENGEGVAVLDPHGDLVEGILGIIPAKRVDDVVLVDMSDEEYSVGFNIIPSA